MLFVTVSLVGFWCSFGALFGFLIAHCEICSADSVLGSVLSFSCICDFVDFLFGGGLFCLMLLSPSRPSHPRQGRSDGTPQGV